MRHLGSALLASFLFLAVMVAAPPEAGAYEQRFNCGAGSYTDSHGNVYDGDREYSLANESGYVEGSVATYELETWKPRGGTPDPDLSKFGRFQWAEYRFDVPNGDYLVRLHFADILENGPGFRFFDVTVEDSLVLDDYDVIADAGLPHYAVAPAFGITVTDGQLNVIGDETDIDLFVSAIEVVSWPQDTDPPATPTGLVVWPSYHRISLDWDDHPEIDGAGYIVERSDAPGGPYTALHNEPIRTSRYHDVTAGLGSTYYYRVSAIDIWGNQGAFGTEEAGYVRDDNSSLLPVYKIVMDPADYHALLASPESDEYKPATFEFDGETWLNVGVRFRGRIARELPRKSWKVKFNEFVPGQRFLNDQEELNLNAHHGERTLMRENLAWKVNEATGVPASQAQHVQMQLNGNFIGVFTEAEQIDERWLEEHGFNSSGNLYKSQLDYACMQTFPDSLTYTLYWSKKTNRNEGYDDLIAFLELIEATPPEDIYHTLAPIFDIESFVNYYATQIAMANDSFYCHNYYLYHDLVNDMWHYLPWDLDSTFGHIGVYAESPIHITTPLKGNADGATGGNALIRALNGGFFAADVPVPHFRRRYLERVIEIHDEQLASAVMDPQIDAVHGQMIEDARVDWYKWGWEDPTWVNEGAVEIQNYLPARRNHLWNQIFNVGLIMPDQDLFLNEIMTDNDTGLQDEAGDFDDWFELVNVGIDTLDLAGTFLTDDITLPMKWAVPDTVILPGEYLIFWADNEPTEGPTHTNFKLDYEGEFLGLFGTNVDGNQPIDTKSWGFQYRDVSYGRMADGGYNWTVMPTPTPGASNIDTGNLPPDVGPTQHVPQVVEFFVADTVTTTAADANGIETVTLYYKFGDAPGFEIVPMADDGTIGDGEAGDGVWGGEIPGQSEAGIVYYYVVAVDSLGAGSADPRDAPLTTFSYEVGFQPPPLFINEFMASNSTTIADEFGEFDDWVEIYNASADSVPLAGIWLSDNLGNQNKYAFPDSAYLGPFAYVLIWCDNDPLQGPNHADFRLSAGGEEIGLFGPPITGFAIIDSVIFTQQYPDTSYGRCPNGGPTWQFYAPPDDSTTPGTYNHCSVAVQDPGTAPPLVLSFGPVAPNPFHRRVRGTVEIPLALPDRRHVEVYVYDVTGRAVAQITDRVFEPGHHRLVWDGTGLRAARLSSGIYFLRLQAGAEQRTAKITVLR